MGKKSSTETQTSQLGKSDRRATEEGRQAGRDTAAAANSGPWAQGEDPLTGQAIGQYGDLYGQYGQYGGQFMDMSRLANQFGMQTGLEGLGGYMNPMLEQYFAGMDPQYARMYEQAGQTAGQNATMQGAYGGSRSAIMEGQMRGDVQRDQMANYGQAQYQTGRDAAGMLMSDRNRMGQLGAQYAGMGMGALGGQADMTKNQAMMGDYRRNIAQQQAQDEYMRRAAAQQAITGSYGRNKKQVNTSEKSGDLFGDILGIGGTVAGIATGGAGGLLSGLTGGRNPGTWQNPNPMHPGSVQPPTGMAGPLDLSGWNNPWGG